MIFTESSLYEVAGNLNVPHIKTIIKQAGVISVLRITAYYPERHARHSVATLTEQQRNQYTMEIVHEGFYGHRPMTLSVSDENYNNLLDVLIQCRFKKLPHQDDISYNDRSLWLIQQAYGTFLHNVIVAPDRPSHPYSTIVNAIDDYIHEAIREIPFDN